MGSPGPGRDRCARAPGRGEDGPGLPRGSCEPDRDIPLFLRWYEEGRLDLDALVTERYQIEEIDQAPRRLAEGKILGRAVITF